MDSLWCKATDIFRHGTIVEEVGFACAPKMAEHEFASRDSTHHTFEQVIWLCHERPVPCAKGPLARRVFPDIFCGNDVEERDFADAMRMIECQSMRRPCAPVMTCKKKTVVAKRCHDIDLILSHDAKRIIDMVRASIGGANAVAVAAKIGHYDMESPRQLTGDFVPRDMCERVAVQQQEWRAFATMSQEDVGAARPNPSRFEALEQAGIGRKRR